MKSDKKIWGVYNTFDEEELNKLSEFEVWTMIYGLDREITSIFNYLNKGYKDVSFFALVNEEFNLDYLIYYTKKFGVKFDKEPTFGEHIKRTKSFNSWYGFWNNHFRSMNSKEYRNYIIDKSRGLDVSKYMPKVKWTDNLENANSSKKLEKVYR